MAGGMADGLCANERLVHCSGDYPSEPRVARAFVLLGLTALFPWNCILSATDFLNNTAFADLNWPVYSTPAWMVMGLTSQLAIIFCGSRLGVFAQFFIPLMIIGVGTLLVMILALLPGYDDIRFVVSLFLLAVLGGSLGVFQGFVFGLAAENMDRFGNLPGHIMVGMGVAGLVSSGLALATQFVSGSLTVAFVVLFLSIVMLSGASIILYGLVRKLVAERSGVSQQGMSDELEPACVTLASMRAGLTYEFAIFFVFAVTFTVFPATASRWEASGPLPQSSYVTLVFGDFQVMDTVGRLMAERLRSMRVFGRPGPLWLLIVARVAFVPLFSACADASRVGLLGSQVVQLVLMALFALSNGLLSSLAMQCAPGHVPAPARGVVGMAMSFFLVAGIVSGSFVPMLFTFGHRGG